MKAASKLTQKQAIAPCNEVCGCRMRLVRCSDWSLEPSWFRCILFGNVWSCSLHRRGGDHQSISQEYISRMVFKQLPVGRTYAQRIHKLRKFMYLACAHLLEIMFLFKTYNNAIILRVQHKMFVLASSAASLEHLEIGWCHRRSVRRQSISQEYMFRKVFVKFSASRPHAQREHKSQSRKLQHFAGAHFLEMSTRLYLFCVHSDSVRINDLLGSIQAKVYKAWFSGVCGNCKTRSPTYYAKTVTLCNPKIQW